jgi:hypothetical protein
LLFRRALRGSFAVEPLFRNRARFLRVAVTRLVQAANSPMEPTLKIVGDAFFIEYPFHLSPEIIEQLNGRGEIIRPALYRPSQSLPAGFRAALSITSP